MKLTYEDYCTYHANKCNKCKGARRIHRDGIWISCGCQYNATIKYRYDRIPVQPERLKFLSWKDFNGINDNGRLTATSFMDAKTKALEYCFGTTDVTAPDRRSKTLKVHKHISDGKNVIIAGGKQSGKSFVASLILKEVVYAGAIFKSNLSFEWIKGDRIIDGARWETNSSGPVKNIDRELFDHLSEVDFLFVDGVDLTPERGDHRASPDMISINLLFGQRTEMNLPTIVICTDTFRGEVDRHPRAASERWGEEFISLVLNPANVDIRLEKEGKKIG